MYPHVKQVGRFGDKYIVRTKLGSQIPETDNADEFQESIIMITTNVNTV